MIESTKSIESTPARALAVEVLSRVWEENAYAAPTLDAALRRAGGMDPRDKRLATELVYGVLRTSGYLDKRVKKHANNDRWRRKVGVRANMLVAVYSLAFLERIPDHAAVFEAVTAIKREDKPMSGFANAVLRKIAKEETKITAQDAAGQAVPRWLFRELERSLGRDGARAFVAELDAPPLCVWLRAGESRDAWLAELEQARPGARFEPGALSPRAIRIARAGDHRQLPGANVSWVVQEEGAQIVALALGARPGEQVLDACAGRGNKSLVLGELVAPDGAVDAADLHAQKLERLRAGPPGASVRDTFAVDWTAGAGNVERRYDRVLVDAPCSGTGTLRRRPEICGRLAASDIARLAALQARIAMGTATRVRPGGRLVYAVCSVLTAECEGVVEALTKAGLEPTPFDADLPLLAGKTAVRLLPHEHGTDGYFIASFTVPG